tara:strand:- start:724 stop:1008 length:285 start_codon:yes stop_codon:yes gene_type:complete
VRLINKGEKMKSQDIKGYWIEDEIFYKVHLNCGCTVRVVENDGIDCNCHDSTYFVLSSDNYNLIKPSETAQQTHDKYSAKCVAFEKDLLESEVA